MAIYDITDLAFSWNGDYSIGNDGDLEDTSNDQIRSLIQEIQTIANSSIGDWEEHPQYAASLDDFIGEPNNKLTSEAIINRIKTALVANNIVLAGDLDVRTVPVSINELLIMITVNAIATKNNSIIVNKIVVSLAYSYTERGVTYVGAKIGE